MTAYQHLWTEAEPRIAESIERHRKSDLTLHIEDAAGQPLPGVDIAIEQVSSHFLFGANAFMLGGYPSPVLNQRYEDAFVGLFNSATIPFYWRDLEPEPGNLRFEEGSRPIARRPPPDRVVAFCEKHGLSTVGHPLVWDFIKWSAPDWLPNDPAKTAPLWEKRIEQIAARYGNRIARWDVVNEVCCSPDRLAEGRSKPMPENYPRLAFKWADKHLPPQAFLMINEVTGFCLWRRDKYVELIQKLLDDGARISGIGHQFHLFGNDENRKVWSGETFKPADLLATLDDLARFNKPIHISEITLTSLDDDAPGRDIQAAIARNFYRLWFGHPAVHAITWWNVPDGGAAPGEDKVSSGLLDRELRPKPAYHALQQLIRHDWRTSLTARTSKGGALTFRGFHGRYRARITRGALSVTREFDLLPDQPGTLTLRLSQENS